MEFVASWAKDGAAGNRIIQIEGDYETESDIFEAVAEKCKAITAKELQEKQGRHCSKDEITVHNIAYVNPNQESLFSS